MMSDATAVMASFRRRSTHGQLIVRERLEVAIVVELAAGDGLAVGFEHAIGQSVAGEQHVEHERRAGR